MKMWLRLSLLALLAAIFAAGYLPSASAQRRDRFSHATAEHKKKDCNSCHKLPTNNWVAARGFPDVADFPGHAACNSCHTGRQFLALCSACHTPGGNARRSPRFPFPVKSRSQEFSTIFPHNVHQDIIAGVPKRPDVAVAHFVNASFAKPVDDPPTFNNCAICHETNKTLPRFASRIPTDMQPLADAATDPFKPTASFFKSMPSGHQSCFTCHYQGIEPTGVNCAGCHKLTAPYNDSPIVRRYSLKFEHQQKEHSVRDCMTCHVRISQNADLKTMVDADVPFLACVSCHDDKISEELGKRALTDQNKQPAFQCIYCHTTDIGRFPVPKSHDQR